MPSRRTGPRVVLALVILAAGTLALTRTAQFQAWRLARMDRVDLADAAEANPTDARIWSAYAERLVANGEGEKALGAYERAAAALSATDRSAESEATRAGLAYTAARFGTVEQAEALLARPLPSKAVRVLLARGILAMRRNRFEEAQGFFQQACARDSDSAEAVSRLGTCLLARGKPADALPVLKEAARMDSRNAAARADLGEAYALTAQFREAAGAYAEAARLDPSNADYVAQHAQAAAGAARTDDDFETASALLVAAMQASPADHAVLLTLAGLQMRFARMAEARRSYETAVGSMPDNPDAWFNLSTVCSRLGDPTSAALARRRFQELLDRQTKIVELTRQTLIRPQDSGRMLQLSLALRQSGDFRGAFNALKKAAGLDPGNVKVKEMLRQASRIMEAGAPGAMPGRGASDAPGSMGAD